jgi:hypothetical protein
MSSELAIVGQNTGLAPAGMGYSGASRLFDLKPATLSIIQPSSTLEGGVKGKLIIDGDVDYMFSDMRVTLLAEPTEHRQYYVGEPGELNRSPDNLHCFCNAVTRQYDPEINREVETSEPDAKAKYPQAPSCRNCPKGSWAQFRAKQDKGIQTTKADIPQCELSYKAVLIDTVYKMPLNLYVRSTLKEGFEKAMKRLARKLELRSAVTGVAPNIFDVSFKLTTKLVEKGKYKFYILEFSDFEGVEDEDRIAFGAMFQKFAEQVERRASAADAEPIANAVVDAEQSIDEAVTGDAANTVTGTVDTTSEVVDAEYEDTVKL